MYKVYRTIQYIVYILNHLSKCIMVILLCLDISKLLNFEEPLSVISSDSSCKNVNA